MEAAEPESFSSEGRPVSILSRRSVLEYCARTAFLSGSFPHSLYSDRCQWHCARREGAEPSSLPPNPSRCSIRADSSPQICRITGLTTTASGVAQKRTSPFPGAGVLVASPAALLLRQTVNSVRECSPLMGQCAGLHAITLGNSTLPPQMSLALMARLSSIHTFGMVPLMADPVPATKATRTASIRWNGKSGCAD